MATFELASALHSLLVERLTRESESQLFCTELKEEKHMCSVRFFISTRPFYSSLADLMATDAIEIEICDNSDVYVWLNVGSGKCHGRLSDIGLLDRLIATILRRASDHDFGKNQE